MCLRFNIHDRLTFLLISSAIFVNTLHWFGNWIPLLCIIRIVHNSKHCTKLMQFPNLFFWRIRSSKNHFDEQNILMPYSTTLYIKYWVSQKSFQTWPRKYARTFDSASIIIIMPGLKRRHADTSGSPCIFRYIL